MRRKTVSMQEWRIRRLVLDGGLGLKLRLEKAAKAGGGDGKH